MLAANQRVIMPANHGHDPHNTGNLNHEIDHRAAATLPIGLRIGPAQSANRGRRGQRPHYLRTNLWIARQYFDALTKKITS
jgi:hypothetical protein